MKIESFLFLQEGRFPLGGGNDKVKKKFNYFSTRVSKIKKLYYLCVRSAKDHAVVVELVDTLA